MKVANGTLHICSPRAASHYIGGGLAGEGGQNINLNNDSWVDTGDMIELRGERYYFAGRPAASSMSAA